MTPPSKARRTLPAPLVLAAASAMVSIGVIAVLWPRFFPDDVPASVPGDPPIEVDESTPEGVAEAFLDAWRKRAHDEAIRWSVGDARAEAKARAEREAALDPSESAAQRPWQALAADRLRLEVERREGLPDGAVHLRTEAAGEFFGGPYRRVVDFEVVSTDAGFRVRTIRFGEILEAPDAIREEVR